MAYGGGYGVTGPADGLTAAVIDSVRLSYHYLDAGDIDGYVSLFDAGAVLRHPGHHATCGRDQVETAAQRQARSGMHLIQRLFGAGNQVAATGQYSARETGRPVDVEFADIFTVAENGLLTLKATYFFTAPTGRRPA